LNIKYPATPPGCFVESCSSLLFSHSRITRVEIPLKEALNVLDGKFRHMKPSEEMFTKHQMCFTAVADITQLKMESGEAIQDFNLDQFNLDYF
jgi:hypothetical protein